jgi:predicted AAA+ superfamily ATPase
MIAQDLIDVHTIVTAAAPRGYSRTDVLPIDWKTSVIGLTGGRGVGKTTLLLQKYWELFGSHERCLYLSADNVHVAALGIYALGREHFKSGGEAIIIDEAHRAANWSAEIKSLIDSSPNKTIWISGSSSAALAKGGADLSRRVVWYDMPGLSFREYLILTGRTDVPTITFEELARDHVAIARDLTTRDSLLGAFRNYLRHGYYPFFLQGLNTYHQRIQGIIDKVVSEDLPSMFAISPAKVTTLKKILWAIASSDPFQLNVEGLSRHLGIAKTSTYHFLECLEHGRMLQTVSAYGTGLKSVRKPEKVYLDNTSLLAAITTPHRVEPSIGTVRETYICSTLRPRHSIKSLGNVDFLIDNRWAIEVGGPGKGAQQLAKASSTKKVEHLLAIDGIEAGSGNRVPLHLFGLLR